MPPTKDPAVIAERAVVITARADPDHARQIRDGTRLPAQANLTVAQLTEAVVPPAADAPVVVQRTARALPTVNCDHICECAHWRRRLTPRVRAIAELSPDVVTPANSGS